MRKDRHVMNGFSKTRLLGCFLLVGLLIVTMDSGLVYATGFIEKTNYYVDGVHGSDTNPGTSVDRAWRTIQKAANTMVGGDTVYIRGGTYNERVTLEYKSNSSGHYITFTAYPGEQPIIDGTGIDIDYGGGLFHVWETDYIHVEGLRLQNSNGAGIYIGQANRIVVARNYTYNTVKSGIGIWGSSNVVVEGNDIELACNSHPNYPATEENISIASRSFNVVVSYNYVHKAANIPDQYAGGEGINIKDGSHDILVHHNIVHLDERQDGKPSNRLAFGLDAWSSETYSVSFFDNIAYNNGIGFVVESEAGGTARDISVYNNIAYNNKGAGYLIPNWEQNETSLKKNIEFINNNAYKNGTGISINSVKIEIVIIRNNILSQNTQSQIQILAGAQPQTHIDHNLFYGTGNPLGSDYVIGDPLFINPSNADFHLRANSPAINVGTSNEAPNFDFDGIARPRGIHFDIGMFEYFPQISHMDFYLPLLASHPSAP